MFVRCSNCQTQFSLDDRQIGADGAAVRCAVCRYVFRVEPPERANQAWRVQTVDGDLFEAEDLPTLRVWVREGRLHPDDTISRTGKHWIRLGDMPEFSDAFAGFPDLPEVLSSPGGGPLGTDELSAVGPPPSFAGDDGPDDVADAVQPAPREMSERLDMSGLFATPEPELLEDGADPEETVVKGRVHEASEDTVTVGPAVVSRTSLFEDSAQMVLDDLVAPEPEPEPAEVDDEDIEVGTDIVAITEVTPSSPRRKPKHQTTKVRTVAAAREAAPDESGVVRVLGDAGEPEAEPEADAVQPRSESSGRRASTGASMLGAVTAHVKSEPIRPITGPLAVAETEPESSSDAEPADVTLETLENVGPPPSGGRPTWPLFAGLGLLCGAAVVFGIPQVRERVLGTGGSTVQAEAGEQPAALAEVDAAVHDGTDERLAAAVSAAKTAAKGEGLSATARADLVLAAAEARAAQAIGLRLQALHAPSSDASFRADDAADEAAQAFAGVDVERATPTRLARTRARVRLAVGRPEDEVLPLVPADEPELRALVVGAQLWGDANARVPSGLISTLAALPEPSVSAQVLLATAYARGGDDVGAASVRTALKSRAASDPSVKALLAAHGDTAAVADTPASDTPPSAGKPDPAVPPASDSGAAPSEEPEETIIIKDAPKGMSIDKLITRGCDKVDNGDVAGGLKLLLRAFDRRPNDLDVLVCLGAANRKKGISTTALRYYEKALKQSPKFKPALLGAARSASKLGESDKALGYYRRVLAVAPGNAEAKSYVAKKNAPNKKPTPPSGTSDKPKPPSGDRKPEPPKGDRKPEPPKPEPSPQ